MNKYKRITLLLDKTKDQDIIDSLSSKREEGSVINTYIKKLIRKDK